MCRNKTAFEQLQTKGYRVLTLARATTSGIKDMLRPYVRPRRFHAFGVGGPKTGTHSLVTVLRRYRAWHEPLIDHFSQLAMARGNGKLSQSAARERLRRLDRRTWLEFNASYINYFLFDLLLEEFPRAKFVLTIRDCYSWLDSMFNEFLGRPHSEIQLEFHRWYLRSLSSGLDQDGDRALAERGLIDVWLHAWNQHNARMLALIPGDRLLVVRTPDIEHDIPRVAAFLGIPADTLDAGRSHEHKAAAKFGLLRRIDQGYLQTCAAQRCGELMNRFFPEIRDPSDVPGYRPQDAATPAGTLS